MALKVWLPLNGTLENQGLSSLVPSGTPTFLNNGKMGKCISLTPRVSFTGLPKLEKFTILFWLKVDSCSSDWADSLGFTSKQTDGSSAASFRFEATKTTRACSFHNNTPYAITTGSRILITEEQKGEWHHCGFSYDGEHCYTYIDGVLTYTDTGLGGYLIDYFHIGETNNMVGGMNDLRIYDECLSQKRIKEIAKGLCAHYKLEGIGANPNLLYPSSLMANLSNYSTKNWNMGTINNVTSSSWTAEGYSVTTPGNQTGNPNNGRMISVENANTLISAGTKVTFSIDIKGAATTARIRGFYQGTGTAFYSNFVPINEDTTATDSEWHRYYGTFTMPNVGTADTRLFIALSQGYDEVTTRVYRNARLSLADGTTYWIPNKAENEYTELGYDKALITDVSGFGYNGTITGDLIFDSNSPRYAGSTKFNGSSYITTTPGSLAWCNFDNLTISAWMKPTVKPGGWTGSIGIQQDGGTNGKVFSISNYAGNFSVHTDNGSGWVTTQSEALPLNQWSHCVATLSNGTDLKMYINGKLVKTATINYNTATVLSDTRIAIGVDLPGDDEKYTGYYSDARFYSTALSAEDILKLYEISGIIDNKGNVYSYEFIDTNNIIASDKYFTGHTNFYDTFTRSIVEDSESPSGEAMKLTCTANGTQASRGYYFGNVEPWTTAKTKMVHGHTYELSMFVKMNKEATNFKMNVECASSQSQTIFSIGTKYKRLVNTFVYNANSTYSAITNYGTIFNVGDEIFIHSPQIQEVDIQHKLNKNGVLSHSGFDESSQAKIYKYSTEANNFIEI